MTVSFSIIALALCGVCCSSVDVFSTCVPLRRNPLQGLREVEGGLTHFFVAVGFY